jgi:molecular chaperone DnaK
MTWYVGIDLGTTNSAIASFDGQTLRLHKSPEQNDVTPSAIYFDRRGNKFIGQRAYDSAAHNPNQAALRFKRLIGSRTLIHIAEPALSLTPEQCSAEILRALFAYVPNASESGGIAGTVITVPAAFDQVQKEATMAAATLANIGNVALMQEPVAAVMSVMRARPEDSRFLVFDLGGGTLDVALAESISGRVSLLSHGGVAVCGGRDFDRAILEHIVSPWLSEHFSLPAENMEPGSSLERMASWAVERAKIELSSRESTSISLSESELRLKDSEGRELYLDIPVTRAELDIAIRSRVETAIQAAKDALEVAGVSASDVERIVFVGGPTQYRPLRELVSAGLGIPAAVDVNPMTAVAEGAAVFAESMDWSSATRARKASRGTVQPTADVTIGFSYTARTPGAMGRIVAKPTAAVTAGTEFQVDSIDSGWSSGRVALTDGAAINVPLAKMGENAFKIFLFGTGEHTVAPHQNRLVIVRTAATVEAIPASHSVGVEVLEKLGGRPTLAFLVNVGDALPKTGRIMLKAAESLKAGAPGSINVKVWQGDIRNPVTDNRFIGAVKVTGSDLDGGAIAIGDDLQCDYTVLDSGNIDISITVPSIGATVNSGRNFYSPQDGQIDLSNASLQVAEEGRGVLERLNRVVEKVRDTRLESMRDALEKATELRPENANSETNKEALETVLEAKRLLAETRLAHLRELRELELESLQKVVGDVTRQYARPAEITSIDGLFESARRAITRETGDFESYLDEIKGLNSIILWRQDWFVVDVFRRLAASPHLFTNDAGFDELILAGTNSLQADDIERLREVVRTLQSRRIDWGGDIEMALTTNVVKG